MAYVYLLTSGDGSEGNEWYVLGIFSTPTLAEEAKARYELPRPRRLGGMLELQANPVEEWRVDPPVE